jgi:hypothetical protein
MVKRKPIFHGGHRPGDPAPKVWQHDLYHGDFTPYDKNENETLKKYIS